MTIFYIVGGVVAVVVIWLIAAYNGMVNLRNRAEEALSDIDVQLKRRFDLIPNLIEAVKGYMTHEREVLEKVTVARAQVAGTGGDALKREKQENVLSATLKTLFAVAENYPDLKANANFLDLQRELADTENKIQAARRFYNTTVMEFNTRLQTFPNNTMAGTFGFADKQFFTAEAAEKENIAVQF